MRVWNQQVRKHSVYNNAIRVANNSYMATIQKQTVDVVKASWSMAPLTALDSMDLCHWFVNPIAGEIMMTSPNYAYHLLINNNQKFKKWNSILLLHHALFFVMVIVNGISYWHGMANHWMLCLFSWNVPGHVSETGLFHARSFLSD